MSLFEADSIGVSYRARRVLVAASFRAAAGKITVIVGRNGAGKTSLLRAAVGLRRADHGIVRFGGRTYLAPRLSQLARAGLFFLPDRAILDPFVRLGDQLQVISQHFGTNCVASVAGLLGLLPHLHTPPRALSGGELRRSEVALAMVRQPMCLIGDEPFRGIDPKDIDLVAAALRQLASRGAAVVITGHELHVLRPLADAVVWCVAGTTHEFPDPGAAWGNAQLEQEFLGPRQSLRWPA